MTNIAIALVVVSVIGLASLLIYYAVLKRRYSNNSILQAKDTLVVKNKVNFKETFDKISTEFSIVFRKMFKGGNGVLKLTDENDLLNTGISILAVPPGKKLNSTSMLSGGEKALCAIAIIFAILAIKDNHRFQNILSFVVCVVLIIIMSFLKVHFQGRPSQFRARPKPTDILL